MTPKPRKDDALTVDMHIRMSERDRAELEKEAAKALRTPGYQALHYIRQGLVNDQDEVSPSADKGERIYDATRAGLQGKKSAA